MNSPTNGKSISNSLSGTGAAEETLRIIATLPAPEGLEDRVREALARDSGTARVLTWPSAGSRHGYRAAARGVAAAAIVLVVGGGGWGVYSRVHPAQVPRVVAMPRVAAPGGFSSAGAMRTPQTLNGPVLAHPVAPTANHASAQPQANLPKKAKKTGEAVVSTKAPR